MNEQQQWGAQERAESIVPWHEISAIGASFGLSQGMAKDLVGKTFVVTGANTGIGRATAEAFAMRGGRVVFAGRSTERTEPVMEALRSRDPSVDVSFLKLDLASLAATAEAARELLAREPRIDVLVLNAGLAGHQGQTSDGFEIQFGVNHLGHYLFARLLLDRLKESAPARVVVVASGNHKRAKGIDYEAVRQPTATTVGLHEYNVSKLANVLFTKELARRLEGTGVTTYALNPGRVASDVWRRLPGPAAWLFKKTMLTNEQGALTSIYCATDPAIANVSGRYYDKSAETTKYNPLADDEAAAKELWDESEAWVAEYL